VLAAEKLLRADCPPSARYVMPDGVTTTPADVHDKDGVAPADLPGSRAGFAVPPVIAFDLATNPLGPNYSQAYLDLGEVAIDRKTGETSIDGQALGDADPCVAAPKADQPAKGQSQK
jgi:hypothetical protein